MMIIGYLIVIVSFIILFCVEAKREGIKMAIVEFSVVIGVIIMLSVMSI